MSGLCRSSSRCWHHTSRVVLRTLSTSTASEAAKDWLKKWLVKEGDLNKRPSDLEIKRKGLPANTPTLGERIRRSHSSELFENDRKGGYYKGPTGTWRDHVPYDLTLGQLHSQSLQFYVNESKKLIQELRKPLNVHEHCPNPGETRTEYTFDSDESRSNWVVTADSSWGEGYSSASLVPSTSGRTALFHGELVTRVPPDGFVNKSGYVNIRSKFRRRSFNRLEYLNFEPFTHLTLRLRGDGRCYILNLHPYNRFDVMWHDLWTYPLHTRGGPYWQDVCIPFNKFFLTNKGKIQDKQSSILGEQLLGLGITLSDTYDGPFCLEIDHIGFAYLPNPERPMHHAYEMRRMPSRGFNLY